MVRDDSIVENIGDKILKYLCHPRLPQMTLCIGNRYLELKLGRLIIQLHGYIYPIVVSIPIHHNWVLSSDPDQTKYDPFILLEYQLLPS